MSPDPAPDRRDQDRPVVLGSLQLVAGVGTMLAAPRLARSPLGPLDRTVMVRVVRFLGLRQALQGLATVTSPHRPVLLGGAGVDAAHALSLVPLVAVPGPYRRLATGSAGLALAAAGAALALGLREPRSHTVSGG